MHSFCRSSLPSYLPLTLILTHTPPFLPFSVPLPSFPSSLLSPSTPPMAIPLVVAEARDDARAAAARALGTMNIIDKVKVVLRTIDYLLLTIDYLHILL